MKAIPLRWSFLTRSVQLLDKLNLLKASKLRGEDHDDNSPVQVVLVVGGDVSAAGGNKLTSRFCTTAYDHVSFVLVVAKPLALLRESVDCAMCDLQIRPRPLRNRLVLVGSADRALAMDSFILYLCFCRLTMFRNGLHELYICQAIQIR